jgi:hypothetical protein
VRVRFLTRRPFASALMAGFLALTLHVHAERPVAPGTQALGAPHGTCEACAALHGASEPPAPVSLPTPPISREMEASPAPLSPAFADPFGLPVPRGPPVTIA